MSDDEYNLISRVDQEYGLPSNRRWYLTDTSDDLITWEHTASELELILHQDRPEGGDLPYGVHYRTPSRTDKEHVGSHDWLGDAVAEITALMDAMDVAVEVGRDLATDDEE